MTETLTAHAITGCYALCHRIALRADEVVLLDQQGQALTPDFWRETKSMLALADRADGPTSIELGFESILHAWLGGWWLRVDLNHRPQHYECRALTN